MTHLYGIDFLDCVSLISLNLIMYFSPKTSCDAPSQWMWLLWGLVLHHLVWSCLLQGLTSCQSGHGTTDWFQTGKGESQGCILSPCLFKLHAEYTMRNAGLDEAQAGIKIAGRNINNLRYADDTTLMAES